ncbi:MAG: polysaccharide deacetylase family protein [Candidatus Odinarchaeota archaeon]
MAPASLGKHVTPPLDLEWNAKIPVTTKYIDQAIEIYQACCDTLEQCPSLKLTLSISGHAFRLIEQKAPSILDELRNFLQDGNLELLGTSYTHAFLPFLSEADLAWDITEHLNLLQSLFGYKPEGFFPPEAGISSKVTDIVKDLGFSYILGEDWCTFPCDGCSLDENVCKWPDYPRSPFLLRGKRQKILYIPRNRSRSIWKFSPWGIMNVSESQFVLEQSQILFRDVQAQKSNIHVMFTDGEILGAGKRMYKSIPKLLEATQSYTRECDHSVIWDTPGNLLKKGIIAANALNLPEVALTGSDHLSWNIKYRIGRPLMDGNLADNKLMDLEFTGVITDGWDYWREFEPNYLLAGYLLARSKEMIQNKQFFALSEATRRLGFTSCWYGWHPTEWRILVGFFSWYLFHRIFSIYSNQGDFTVTPPDNLVENFLNLNLRTVKSYISYLTRNKFMFPFLDSRKMVEIPDQSFDREVEVLLNTMKKNFMDYRFTEGYKAIIRIFIQGFLFKARIYQKCRLDQVLHLVNISSKHAEIVSESLKNVELIIYHLQSSSNHIDIDGFFDHLTSFPISIFPSIKNDDLQVNW